MQPALLAILLVAAGVVVLLAEMLLPTHGLLGLLGAGLILSAVAVCFTINQWTGLIALGVVVILAPIVTMWMIHLWPKTPVGRRLTLQPLNKTPPKPILVKIGQVGIAISELRPMGECDFGEIRLESISELGIIESGQKVKVVAVEGDRPIVRPVIASTSSTQVA